MQHTPAFTTRQVLLVGTTKQKIMVRAIDSTKVDIVLINQQSSCVSLPQCYN